MKVITPTIGRRVWFWPSDYDRGLLESKPESIIQADVESSGQPCDAGVVRVWGDRMVNLAIADHNGNMHKRTSVPLVQPGDAVPSGYGYCTWMDYQVAQSNKETPQPDAAEPAIPLGRVGDMNQEGPDHVDDTQA